MEPNFFLGGQANGSVANLLVNSNMDPNVLRAWVGRDGRAYRAIQNGLDPKTKMPRFKTVIHNGPATLRKDEWILVDTAVERIARTPMTAWSDLRGISTYRVPNGLGTIVIQHSTMSDFGVASISMDGLRETERDRPTFDIRGIPLPIISSDFSFTAREIAVSRNGGPGLDTNGAEMATYQVMTQLEGLTLGTAASFSYAGYSVYGYTNLPARATYIITPPTTPGWTPATFIDDLLAMRQLLVDRRFIGPYLVYLSPAWMPYLDTDYSELKGENTMRQRAAAIGLRIDIAYYLTGYTALMINADSRTCQAVVGMDVRTLQWESHGGMVINFKVMCIMIPRLRWTADGFAGIVHAA